MSSMVTDAHVAVPAAWRAADRFSVRRGLAPLDAMAETLGRRYDSDLRPLGVDPMPTELRPLLNAINGHFSRVATARDREKSFTAFAAHELKTPLAGLKSQAQIYLMTTDEGGGAAPWRRSPAASIAPRGWSNNFSPWQRPMRRALKAIGTRTSPKFWRMQ